MEPDSLTVKLAQWAGSYFGYCLAATSSGLMVELAQHTYYPDGALKETSSFFIPKEVWPQVLKNIQEVPFEG